MNNQALEQPIIACEAVCQNYHQTAQALRQHQGWQFPTLQSLSEDANAEWVIAEVVYIYDLVEQRNICTSRSITEMLGYTAVAIANMDALELADLIHPADLERVADHFLHFATLPVGVVAEINYRMKQPDGEWCWLRSCETPLIEAVDRYPRTILGVIQRLSRPTMIEHAATGKGHKMIADEVA